MQAGGPGETKPEASMGQIRGETSLGSKTGRYYKYDEITVLEIEVM